MLDVQFLLKPPGHLDRPLVYFYGEGTLRTSVLRAMDRLQGDRGYWRREVNAIGRGGGLFDEMPYWDLIDDPELAAIAKRKKLSKFDAQCWVLAEYSKAAVAPSALLAPLQFAALPPQLQAEVTANCFVVEEESSDDESLFANLSYLESTTDLIADANLNQQEAFISYFKEFANQHRRLKYSDILGEFERAVLRWTDDKTGIFRGKRAKANLRGRGFIANPLKKLILKRDEQSLAPTLHGFELRYPKAATARVVAALIDETCGLLRSCGSGRSDGFDIEADLASLSVWSAVLLTAAYGEQNELDDGAGVLVVDRIGRDFLARVRNADLGRSLDGLWTMLRAKPINVHVGEKLRAALVRVLAPHVDVSRFWLQRLYATLAAASGHQQAAEPAKRAWFTEFKEFSRYIGQGGAVAMLRQRCCNGDHQRPLVLSGPCGVGKRTLARLYGRAAVCQQVGEVIGDACGVCNNCRLFDDDFSVVELDARLLVAADYFREWLSIDRLTLPGGCHVIIIKHAEANSGLIDICLKTLEARPQSVVVIFLVEDVDRMHPACRSRCEVLHLLPLTANQMEQLAMQNPGMPALQPNERELLLSVGNGLPGNLAACHERIALAAASDITGVKRALDLDWGLDAIDMWRSILERRAAIHVDDADAALIADRLRAVLTAAYEVWLGQPVTNPALAFVDQDRISSLVSLFECKAKAANQEFLEFWQEVAELFGNSDLDDQWGIQHAVRLLRAGLRFTGTT